ncbi:hypothetical protein V9T40_004781 [Parthenolecanium corni]|uniref:DUF4772 domain-containing protein n=1 Tax=Parthenolecanium corni TaxID=536013 RepID=A0AAN9Y3L5_9HEMI
MSTGKRLAKRSIIGTRVCAPGEDGLFYSGVIQSVKTTAAEQPNSNGSGCGTGTGNCDFAEPNVDTQYSVRFDLAFASKKCPAVKRDFYGSQIIGPGFQPLSNFHLLPGQKVYLTYNGREISGHIVRHNALADEVTVSINPPGHEVSLNYRNLDNT